MFKNKWVKRLLALLGLLFVISSAVLVLLTVRDYIAHPVPKTAPSVALLPPVTTPGEVNTGDLEELVNQVRVQKGLGTLTNDVQLTASAMARAQYLCDHNVWSHDGWISSLTAPLKYSKVGENLEYGVYYETTDAIVQAWVKSPTHYANMTDSRFKTQGMGLKFCEHYQGMDNQLIVVNHFGAPR